MILEWCICLTNLSLLSLYSKEMKNYVTLVKKKREWIFLFFSSFVPFFFFPQRLIGRKKLRKRIESWRKLAPFFAWIRLKETYQTNGEILFEWDKCILGPMTFCWFLVYSFFSLLCNPKILLLPSSLFPFHEDFLPPAPNQFPSSLLFFRNSFPPLLNSVSTSSTSNIDREKE